MGSTQSTWGKKKKRFKGQQPRTNQKIKMKLVVGIAFLALAVCSRAAPRGAYLTSDLTYLHESASCLSSDSCLSRKRRQDSGDDDNGDSFRQLLLEIRQVAAATIVNYDCGVDISGNEFTQNFLTAYSSLVRNVDPEEKILTTARKITAKLVNDYGCAAGTVTWTNPTLGDKFKAAYAREILEVGNGPEKVRKIAAKVMTNGYNCGKINPDDKDFIEKFLSTFVDVKDYAKIRTKQPDYDPEGNDLARWHIAQLIKKYGCGNPDHESEEFKSNYFMGSLTVALDL